MKRNLTKAVLVLLAVIMAVLVFVACDNNTQTTELSVKIYDGETLLDTIKVTDGKLPAAAAQWSKADYEFVGLYTDKDFTTEFDAKTAVTADLTLYAKFEKVTYTLTVNTNGAGTVAPIVIAYGDAITLPELEKEGYEFLGYTYRDEEYNVVAFDFETYPFRKNNRIEALWKKVGDTTVDFDGSEATFVSKGNYFKERATTADAFTYVFLTGHTYDFGAATVSTEDGYDFVSLRDGGKSFGATAVTAGNATFTLTVTPVSGDVKSIKARVVESVNTFGFGADYNNMISNVNREDLFGTVTTADAYVLDVANSNFIPDISATNQSNKALTLAEANVTVTIDGTDVTASLNGNVLDLAAGLVGDAVKTITFTPKYLLTGVDAVSLKVRINDGVNVYTNEELKSAYSDPSVQKINILRSIVAELSDEDYYVAQDGTRAKFDDVELTNVDGSKVVLTGINIGTPKNDDAHGVYVRSTNKKDDNLVINGNYYSIDGSKLPYINNLEDGWKFQGMNGCRIANVQAGIFLYRCVDQDYYGSIIRKYSDGNVTMKNLSIGGNYIQEYQGATQDLGDDGLPLLKMSAAYNGVVVRGGTMNLDNVAITNTTIALFGVGGVSGYQNAGVSEDSLVKGNVQPNETQATKFNVDNSIIDVSWMCSAYSWDLSAFTFRKTDFGVSNGAVIMVDDIPYVKEGASYGNASYSNLNAAVTMDLDTALSIQNWKVGSETWFNAYYMSDLAMGAKTLMEGAVSGNSMTILKYEDDDNDPKTPDVSVMNFAIIGKTDYTSSLVWGVDKDGSPMIDVSIFTTSPFNASPEGTIVFPVTSLVDQAEMGALAAKLQSFGEATAFLTTYLDQAGATAYFGEHPEEYPGDLATALIVYATQKYFSEQEHLAEYPGSPEAAAQYVLGLLMEKATIAEQNFNTTGAFLNPSPAAAGGMFVMIPVYFVNPFAAMVQ